MALLGSSNNHTGTFFIHFANIVYAAQQHRKQWQLTSHIAYRFQFNTEYMNKVFRDTYSTVACNTLFSLIMNRRYVFSSIA